jgi:hypothetical protein
MLTQRSYTGFKGASFMITAAMKDVIRATTLTVS